MKYLILIPKYFLSLLSVYSSKVILLADESVSKYKTQINESFANWNHNHKIVNEIMEKLNRTPTNWYIKFEGLSIDCKQMLFPLLKKFWEENIETLSVKDKYKISFKVNGEWHYSQLTPEIYNNLMQKFDEQRFIFDLDKTSPEYFYEQGGEELPNWNLFSDLSFSIYQRYKKRMANMLKSSIIRIVRFIL